MKKRCTIPLLVIFGIQSLVVIGAFVAVILVLTIQQGKDFRSSVFNRMQLVQRGVRCQVYELFRPAEEFAEYLATLTTTNPEGRRLVPTSTLLSLQPFFIESWPYGKSPGRKIAQQFASTTHFYKDDPEEPIKNLASVDGAIGVLFLGINGSATYYSLLSSGWPISSSKVQSAGPFDIRMYSKLTELRYLPLDTEWNAGASVKTGIGEVETVVTTSISRPLSHRSWKGRNVTDAMITITVEQKSLAPLIANSILAPGAVVALLSTGASTNDRLRNVQAAYITGTVEGLNNSSREYSCPTTPNSQLNAVCEALAAEGCPVSPTDTKCNEITFEMKSENLIVSMARLRTPTKLDFFVVQYIPRDFFFSEFERNRIVGVCIGILAAAIVVISCILIWFAVSKPLERLQNSMDHAAALRNDEAAETAGKDGGFLTEMSALHATFLRMNGRLLQARPYLPQSLLVETEEEEDEEGAVDLVAVGHMASMSVLSGVEAGSINYSGANPSMKNGSAVNSSIIRNQQGMPRQHSTVSLNHPSRSQRSPDINSSLNATRTQNSHKMAAAAGGGERRFITAVTTRKCSMLVLNTKSYHSTLEGCSSQQLTEAQAKLVETVLRCASGERGIVDHFNGDHFLISFNTARLLGTPGRNAALCALSLERSIPTETIFTSGVSIGVATGRCNVGNMGSKAMMKHGIVGAAVPLAAYMEQLSQRHCRQHSKESRSYFTEDMSADVELSIVYETVGWMSQHDTTDALLRTVVYALVMPRSAMRTDDEWLYAMQADNTKDPFSVLNEIMSEVVHTGNMPDANQQSVIDAIAAGKALTSSNSSGGNNENNNNTNNSMNNEVLTVLGPRCLAAALRLEQWTRLKNIEEIRCKR